MSRPVREDARMEIKFIAREFEFTRLTHWLRLHEAEFFMPYPDRWVNNVYFDTHDNFAFRENLYGASERTKVRYRWYAESSYIDKGTLEIKCKRNYFGWKLRFRAPACPSANGARWRDIRRGLIEQLGPEARKWLESYPQPVIINRYHRSYFLSRDEKIRITVDSKQTVFDQRYKPYPNFICAANTPRTLVLECKFARHDRDLASRIIQGLPLRVSRNSKYTIGVRAIHGY